MRKLSYVFDTHPLRWTRTCRVGHTRADTIHTRADTIHTRADTIHTRADTIHTRADMIHTCADTGGGQQASKKLTEMRKLVLVDQEIDYMPEELALMTQLEVLNACIECLCVRESRSLSHTHTRVCVRERALKGLGDGLHVRGAGAHEPARGVHNLFFVFITIKPRVE